MVSGPKMVMRGAAMLDSIVMRGTLKLGKSDDLWLWNGEKLALVRGREE